MCRFCKKDPCYEHCQEADTGEHEADVTTATVDRDTLQQNGDFIVDFNCKRCGQSGGMPVKLADIQWG